MTNTVDVAATEVDPLDDKVLTLQFTVKQINGILTLLGNELPYVKVAQLIGAFHDQCIPQVEALRRTLEQGDNPDLPLPPDNPPVPPVPPSVTGQA